MFNYELLINIIEMTNEEILTKFNLLNKLKNIRHYEIKLFYISNYGAVREKNTFIITNDDKVYVLGNNSNGTLGLGHNNKVFDIKLNEFLSNKQIIDFNNGFQHTIGRTVEGKLYVWGCNRCGVLGNGKKDLNYYKPEENQDLSNKHIISISCGAYHTLILTIDGELYMWGDNRSGQFGQKTVDNHVLNPFHINLFSGEKVKSISCGSYHSMVITITGKVYVWGSNYFNGTYFQYEPTLLNTNINFNSIVCCLNHSLLLSTDGDVYVFGDNMKIKYKSLDKCDKNLNIFIPNKVKTKKKKFQSIASHYASNISSLLSTNGKYYVLGNKGKKVYKKFKKSSHNSYIDVFANYEEITYETIIFDKHYECTKL